MTVSTRNCSAILLGLGLLAGCTTTVMEPAGSLGIGRSVDAEEIARWDIDVGPDGTGLPPGTGSASAGAESFRLKCAACHGSDGEGGPNDRLIAPWQDGINHSLGSVPRGIGNYWPYATTLFDYIRRAMPHNAPGSLSDQEVYDLTAWLLYRNDIIPVDAVISQETLPQIDMPGRSLFHWSDEAEP